MSMSMFSDPQCGLWILTSIIYSCWLEPIGRYMLLHDTRCYCVHCANFTSRRGGEGWREVGVSNMTSSDWFFSFIVFSVNWRVAIDLTWGIMCDLGREIATSDLWHCQLTSRVSIEVTDLDWPHTGVLANTDFLFNKCQKWHLLKRKSV